MVHSKSIDVKHDPAAVHLFSISISRILNEYGEECQRFTYGTASLDDSDHYNTVVDYSFNDDTLFIRA